MSSCRCIYKDVLMQLRGGINKCTVQLQLDIRLMYNSNILDKEN